MATLAKEKSNCSYCLFWRLLRPKEGLCQRNAPNAGDAEQIAHWPETHADQWCGAFETASSARVLTECGDCRFWRRPPNGFEPDDKSDKLASWWAKAGNCARHAPRPSSDPGPRAFWLATHATDQCAEGMPTPGSKAGPR
jgi:hypothetical protein